jgi:phosphoribosylglycinamide formyltransferase-1
VETLVVTKQDYPTREAFDARVLSELKQRGIDWVVLAGFMRLLTPMFVEAFPNRILNVHPSLLPAFPGLDAGRQAFEYGSKVTGCTVHLVSEEMDAGPVVAQTAVPILEEDSLDSLMQRIHAAEHQTLLASVIAAVTGRLQLLPSDANSDGRLRVKVLPA